MLYRVLSGIDHFDVVGVNRLLVVRYDTTQDVDVVQPVKGKARWQIDIWVKTPEAKHIQTIIAPKIIKGAPKHKRVCYLSQVLPVAQQVLAELSEGEETIQAGYAIYKL